MGLLARVREYVQRIAQCSAKANKTFFRAILVIYEQIETFGNPFHPPLPYRPSPHRRDGSALQRSRRFKSQHRKDLEELREYRFGAQTDAAPRFRQLAAVGFSKS